MEFVLEILKLTLPSLFVIIMGYLVLNNFLKREEKMHWYRLKMENSKQALPVKLQAYERSILLLERISPNNLVMRVYKSGMSAREFHSELLKNIRQEFDHNLTQQIYLSPEAWEAIKRTKEEVTKMINIAASKVKEDDAGINLSKVILDMTIQMETLPNQIAIDAIKREIRTIF